MPQNKFKDSHKYRRKQDNHFIWKKKQLNLKNQQISLDKRPVGKAHFFAVPNQTELTKKQTLCLIFFIMLMNSEAINVLKQHESNTLKNICEDKSKQIFNKHNISYGMEKGVLKPTSCITHGFLTFSCLRDLMLTYYIPLKDRQPLDKEREKTNIYKHRWKKGYIDELKKIPHSQLTLKQKDLIRSLIINIDFFKEQHLSHLSFHRLDGGNCGEHASDAIIKILRHRIKYNLKIKMQLITVRSSTAKNYIYDHVYILLNSNVGDIIIHRNIKAVEKFLKEIKKGEICDPWNLGHYVNFTEDRTGLYTAEAEWDNLKVFTVSLEIKDFHILPKPFKKIFCEELLQMDLDLIYPKNACQQFMFDSNSTISSSDNFEDCLLQSDNGNKL